MNKEKLTIIAIDVVFLILLVVSFCMSGDAKYWVLISAFLWIFVGYHVVAFLLNRHILKEEVDRMVEEYFDSIKEMEHDEDSPWHAVDSKGAR